MRDPSAPTGTPGATRAAGPRRRGVARPLHLACWALCALCPLLPWQGAAGQRAAPAAAAVRQELLERLARSYFPGRTGQVVVVPREGHVVTRPDPDVTFMHGSPWPYDADIPLLLVGPAVKPGVYAGAATQQDVAPTLAAALGVRLPPTATGRVLPALRTGVARPRAVLLLVLDGMRRDYFDRHAARLPTLAALRRRGAWFAAARVSVLPTTTAIGHATISTGADPRAHGITGNSVWDRRRGARHDPFAGGVPADLTALTLSDVWQLATGGRAVVLAQGSIDRAATALAGHGACQLNGAAVAMAFYDPPTGGWRTNPDCFRLPAYLEQPNASALWREAAEWMGHRVDSPAAVRYSALFPGFEADAMVAMLGREPVGEDDVPDLILMNAKGADYVGHRYGPDSEELRATLAAIDAAVARVLRALEARVGQDYLLAVTADHGMPGEPGAARRHFAPAVVDRIHDALDPTARKLVASYEPENGQLYLDEGRLAALRLAPRDVARVLEGEPWVLAAFTADEVRACCR